MQNVLNNKYTFMLYLNWSHARADIFFLKEEKEKEWFILATKEE